MLRCVDWSVPNENEDSKRVGCLRKVQLTPFIDINIFLIVKLRCRINKVGRCNAIITATYPALPDARGSEQAPL